MPIHAKTPSVLTVAAALALTLGGCGGGSDDSPPPADAVAQLSNGASSAASTNHWRRTLAQSTEHISFYSDQTGGFISGGSCASGTHTWTKTSATSISVTLPVTAGANSCPRAYTYSNIAVSSGQFSATLDNGVNGAQAVTYTLIGGHI